MKLTSVLATVLLAVAVQAALARYTVGGVWVFDLVLVGVIYAALQWGPVAGILAGTVGGLLQDLLAGGIVGVGGLTKTLVGFVAGVVGAQFLLAKPGGRTVILAAATVIHRVMALALLALIEQQWQSFGWGSMAAEVGINSVVGFVAFQFTDAAPGLMERGRMSRRSSLSRRRW